ncbi:hypothetical protein [Pseudoalteromonas galatheae]|uniref:hypothetical protein n=1 Tax=Pseudoalteromonas galatheae TaxID=579562 RepID=UPI0030D424AD
MKNLIIINVRRTAEASIAALRYAETLQSLNAMYCDIYNITEINSISRLVEYYLPSKHRMLIVIGTLTDSEVHQLMSSGNAIYVTFRPTLVKVEDAELSPGQTHINANLFDPHTLYDWLIHIDG